jgi:hypothetical protein
MSEEGQKHRIVYVGNFHEHSVGEPEIANCLEELGHKVFRLEERSPLTDINKIKSVIQREQCNMLLFAKLRINNTPKEIQEFLQNLEIPKVCWVFDLYWNM